MFGRKRREELRAGAAQRRADARVDERKARDAGRKADTYRASAKAGGKYSDPAADRALAEQADQDQWVHAANARGARASARGNEKQARFWF